MKVRLRFVVALAVTLVFAACVGLSGSLSPEQALNSKLIDAGQATCPGGAPIIFGMTESGQKVLLSKDKAIVVYFDKAGDVESVAFGDVALVDGKVVFTLQEKLSPEQTQAKYPHPCAFLAPREV